MELTCEYKRIIIEAFGVKHDLGGVFIDHDGKYRFSPPWLEPIQPCRKSANITFRFDTKEELYEFIKSEADNFIAQLNEIEIA